MYKKLTRNVVISAAQTIISGGVLLVLYRYLIDHLGAEQLGLWSVVLASTSVARLSDMGLTGSVVKFVARSCARKDEPQASVVVQTAVLSIASVMGVLCVAIFPLLDNVLVLAIPDSSIPQAIGILPWAVFSFWLGSVAGVFQAGLDGCQRIDIRNIIIIFGNVFFLAAAICLVPYYGINGLAISQVVQCGLIMLISWLVLRCQLKSLPWIPHSFSWARFKEMFGYAVNFQINSIAILLFDPAIKFMMSHYGGLSSAANYEMASQFVIRLRALLVSTTQSLVPTVAELHETAPSKICDLYAKSYRMVFLLTILFYATIFISLPLVSEIWIGHLESQFIIFGSILAFSWGLNTLTSPAYFVNFGTGSLEWNSIAHVLMAILNVLLGLMLGPIFGGLGVIIGAIIALVFASIFVIIAFHKQYKISLLLLLPREHTLLLVTTAVCTAIVACLYSTHILKQQTLLISFSGIVFYLFVVSMVICFHPYKSILQARIHDSRLFFLRSNSK